MTFTDEQLTNLKARINKRSHNPTMLFSEDWNALISRLEAAEAVIELLHDEMSHYPEINCKGCHAAKAWRKAAGK